MTKHNQPLQEAPEHIKLAVDLIYLLESNNIHSSTALEALKIVEEDLKNKLASEQAMAE